MTPSNAFANAVSLSVSCITTYACKRVIEFTDNTIDTEAPPMERPSLRFLGRSRINIALQAMFQHALHLAGKWKSSTTIIRGCESGRMRGAPEDLQESSEVEPHLHELLRFREGRNLPVVQKFPLYGEVKIDKAWDLPALPGRKIKEWTLIAFLQGNISNSFKRARRPRERDMLR
jgi:hypothetical protein